ncbi:MAG: hypothetical protein ABSB01_26365 [Streptosporangiaceae bacterium]
MDCPTVFEPAPAGDGTYTGNDPPSVLFYSNRPGSGNNSQYLIRLPKEPPVPPNQSATGGTYSFQLERDLWFMTAACATQSYPRPPGRGCAAARAGRPAEAGRLAAAAGRRSGTPRAC